MGPGRGWGGKDRKKERGTEENQRTEVASFALTTFSVCVCGGGWLWSAVFFRHMANGGGVQRDLTFEKCRELLRRVPGEMGWGPGEQGRDR